MRASQRERPQFEALLSEHWRRKQSLSFVGALSVCYYLNSIAFCQVPIQSDPKPIIYSGHVAFGLLLSTHWSSEPDVGASGALGIQQPARLISRRQIFARTSTGSSQQDTFSSIPGGQISPKKNKARGEKLQQPLLQSYRGSCSQANSQALYAGMGAVWASHQANLVAEGWPMMGTYLYDSCNSSEFAQRQAVRMMANANSFQQETGCRLARGSPVSLCIAHGDNQLPAIQLLTSFRLPVIMTREPMLLDEYQTLSKEQRRFLYSTAPSSRHLALGAVRFSKKLVARLASRQNSSISSHQNSRQNPRNALILVSRNLPHQFINHLVNMLPSQVSYPLIQSSKPIEQLRSLQLLESMMLTDTQNEQAEPGEKVDTAKGKSEKSSKKRIQQPTILMFITQDEAIDLVTRLRNDLAQVSRYYSLVLITREDITPALRTLFQHGGSKLCSGKPFYIVSPKPEELAEFSRYFQDTVQSEAERSEHPLMYEFAHLQRNMDKSQFDQIDETGAEAVIKAVWASAAAFQSVLASDCDLEAALDREQNQRESSSPNHEQLKSDCLDRLAGSMSILLQRALNRLDVTVNSTGLQALDGFGLRFDDLNELMTNQFSVKHINKECEMLEIGRYTGLYESRLHLDEAALSRSLKGASLEPWPVSSNTMAPIASNSKMNLIYQLGPTSRTKKLARAELENRLDVDRHDSNIEEESRLIETNASLKSSNSKLSSSSLMEEASSTRLDIQDYSANSGPSLLAALGLAGGRELSLMGGPAMAPGLGAEQASASAALSGAQRSRLRSHLSWIYSSWSALSILAANICGALLTLYVLTYLLLRNHHSFQERDSRRSLSSLHLLAIILVFFGSTLFIVHPTPGLCLLRASWHNFALVMLFGSLLLQAMQIRSASSLGLGGRTNKLNQLITLLFMAGVQVAFELQRWKYESSNYIKFVQQYFGNSPAGDYRKLMILSSAISDQLNPLASFNDQASPISIQVSQQYQSLLQDYCILQDDDFFQSQIYLSLIVSMLVSLSISNRRATKRAGLAASSIPLSASLGNNLVDSQQEAYREAMKLNSSNFKAQFATTTNNLFSISLLAATLYFSSLFMHAYGQSLANRDMISSVTMVSIAFLALLAIFLPILFENERNPIKSHLSQIYKPQNSKSTSQTQAKTKSSKPLDFSQFSEFVPSDLRRSSDAETGSNGSRRAFAETKECRRQMRATLAQLGPSDDLLRDLGCLETNQNHEVEPISCHSGRCNSDEINQHQLVSESDEQLVMRGLSANCPQHGFNSIWDSDHYSPYTADPKSRLP